MDYEIEKRTEDGVEYVKVIMKPETLIKKPKPKKLKDDYE